MWHCVGRHDSPSLMQESHQRDWRKTRPIQIVSSPRLDLSPCFRSPLRQCTPCPGATNTRLQEWVGAGVRVLRTALRLPCAIVVVVGIILDRSSGRDEEHLHTIRISLVPPFKAASPQVSLFAQGSSAVMTSTLTPGEDGKEQIRSVQWKVRSHRRLRF